MGAISGNSQFFRVPQERPRRDGSFFFELYGGVPEKELGTSSTPPLRAFLFVS